MLLNKEIFNSKSKIQQVFIVAKTLTPEKSFYFYTSVLSIIILAFFAICVGLKNKYTIASPKYSQRLNIHSGEKVKSFIPLFADSRTEKIISKMLFSGILKQIDSDKYVPDLAEKVYISDDGLEIEIRLRDDSRFSNGENITSDDIIYTYKLMQSFEIDNRDRAKYEGLEFEKIDNKNIKITLKKRYSQINKLLCLGIISKKEYSKEKISNLVLSDENLKPNTSGQYKINALGVVNNKIESISMVNNNSYNTLASFRYVDFYFQDLSGLAKKVSQNYFTDNKIDISLDNSDSESFDRDLYTEIYYNTNISSYIFLNPNKNDALSKKINREFLYKNIDRDYIVDSILGAMATSSYDIMPNSKKRENAPAGLSSFASSSVLTLTYLNTVNNQKIYNYLRDDFLKYNIEIRSNPLNQEGLQSVIKNREFEMLLTNIEIEDVSSLYSFFHSSQKNAPGLNIGNYVSKNFDKNIEMLRSATNTNISENSLESMRQEFYQEYPYIPLYSKKGKIIMSKQVATENQTLENLNFLNKEKENIYFFLEKYRDIIIKVNKIIH